MFGPTFGVLQKLESENSVIIKESGDWPTYESELLVDKNIELVIQINGKVRAKKEVDANIEKEDAIEIAKSLQNIQAHLDGKQIIKEIYVPGKLVNIVVK